MPDSEGTLMRALSGTQIRALVLVSEGKAYMGNHGGGVRLNTLWSLENYGLVRTFGFYDNSRAKTRLTPFGKQFLRALQGNA